MVNKGRSFWRGVLTGSLIGAALTFLLVPRLRGRDARKSLAERTRQLTTRAGRWFRRTREQVEDLGEPRH